jgi:hypothetical protein
MKSWQVGRLRNWQRGLVVESFEARLSETDGYNQLRFAGICLLYRRNP